MEITINRGIYKQTLTEEDINEILTQNSFLKSILLMEELEQLTFKLPTT